MTLRPITLIGIVVSMVTGVGLGIIGYRTLLAERSDYAHALAFDAVLNQVYESYVDEVDKDQLMVHALQGMLTNLDDHSLFLDSAGYDDLQAETTGHFGGVGIEVGMEQGQFTVVAPLHGTPAARAGLLAGDRIVELDHEPLEGKTLVDVVGVLRGPPGSSVHLRIQRDSEVAPRDVSLTRAVIEVESVEARLLEPGYGYVRITQFQTGTGRAFENALRNLMEQADGALDGLVLDLRDNPGGVLQASVAVADALLRDGLIVYTQGRLRSSQLKYRASGEDLLEDAPLVVLINGGSASAAEIVAGALQDHGRATIMGSRSYGKGSVQSVVPVDRNQALKLTTAYYFTPSGRSIHHNGIEPDVKRSEPAAQPTADVAQEPLLASALTHLKQNRARTRLHARL